MTQLDYMPKDIPARGYVCCPSPEVALNEYKKETGEEPKAYYIRRSKIGMTTIYVYGKEIENAGENNQH